jgi:hypothetical protein
MNMRRIIPVVALLMLLSGCTVVHTTEGETSSYRFDAMSWLAIGGGGLAIAAIGWFFQRSDDSDTGMGRARGWGGIIIGLVLVICGVPAIATSRVKVTDTSMTLDDRLFWPLPSPKEFKFSELRSVEEKEEERWTRRGKRTTHYMVISKADGTTEKFQIGRLTREAYPEIIQRLAAQDRAAAPPQIVNVDPFGAGGVFDPADVGHAAPSNPAPPAPIPAHQPQQQPVATNAAPFQPPKVAEVASPGVPVKPGDQRGIDPRIQLVKGMRLEAEYAGRWLPVTIVEGGIGGDPKIHWDGWEETWDAVKPRTDLRWPGGITPPSLTAAAAKAAAAVDQTPEPADRSPFRKKAPASALPEDSPPPAQAESPFRPKTADNAPPADSTSPFRPKAPQASPDDETTPAEQNESPFRPKSAEKPAPVASDTDETPANPFRKKPALPKSAAAQEPEDGAKKGAREAAGNAASDSPFRKKPNDKPAAADKTSGKQAAPSGKAVSPSGAEPSADPQPAVDDQQLITAKTPLSKGQKLEGQWGSTWEPVTVLEIQNNGMVKIHWDGRPAAFDKSVQRSTLRLPAKEPEKK